MQKMITECKLKAQALKNKNREERRVMCKVDPLLSRKVLVPGDRWNIGGYCAGVVTRRGKFTPRGSTKKQVGYCVKYLSDNKIEW